MPGKRGSPREATTVGVLIRRRREELELRLEDVASRSRLSLSTVARVEGGGDTTLSTLVAIAEALETTVADLLQSGEAA